MDADTRARLEPIFNSLDPEKAGTMKFPPAGDDGDGDGSDRDLASIILYGSTSEIAESQIEFAIRLGRSLQAAESQPEEDYKVAARRLRDCLAEAFAPNINDPELMRICKLLQSDCPEREVGLESVPIRIVYSAMLIFHRRSREMGQ